MAPAELSEDDIPTIRKGVADVDGMVAAFDVVLPVLLLLCHDGLRMRCVGTVRHGESSGML